MTGKQKLERGQSFVELALTLPFLLIILGLVLDIARAYYVQVALEEAAGQVALYLVINPECRTPADGSGGECADPHNALYYAKHAGGGDLQWENVSLVSAFRPTAYGVGYEAEVEIQYDFHLLTPIIPNVFGISELQLTGHATQKLIAE
jgi:hypothetical protein